MTPALTMVMQRYLPNQMLNDERAAEATMIARIADTAAVNVSLNHLRMKIPLPLLSATFPQSGVVPLRKKLPACTG